MRQLIAVAGVVFCLSANAESTPTTSPPAVAGFIVLTQPVKLKIAYGETTLPAGMRLSVVSSDTSSVRVNYMGQVQTIPMAAARFETSSDDDHQSAAAPSTASTPSTQLASPPAAPAQGQVSLQPGYDTRMQGGDVSMRELQMLLSAHCTEAVDFSGAGTRLYGGVTYLMDSEQAAATLGLGHAVPSRVPVATPGFPRNSLYYIGYDGAFEGHFNRLYLVTDTANKIVAIQFVDENPKGRWKSAAGLAAATWSTYNFINARMRAIDTARVQAHSKRQANAIVIETQLYQRIRSRVGRKNVDRYEEKEDAKLFIPIPFARIILHCAQIGLSKA